MTKPRRPQRVILFTEASIANIPPAQNYSDLWYDTEQPYLAYRASGSIAYRGTNLPASYMVVSGRPVARGAAIAGVKIKRFTDIEPVYASLEAVRVRAKAIHESHLEYAKNGKAIRHNTGAKRLPSGGDVDSPESILDEVSISDNPNYDKLLEALMEAFDQATKGKGAERHAAGGINFEDQDMLKVMDRVGIGFALGQAIKKITEGNRLKRAKARDEFLGAIVYLAGAIVWMKDR